MYYERQTGCNKYPHAPSRGAAAPNLLLRRLSSFLRFCVPPSNPESKPRLAVTMVVSKVQTEPNSRTFPLKVRFFVEVKNDLETEVQKISQTVY
jgi:hypothetical protein